MALLTKYVDSDATDETGDGSIGDPWKRIWQATAAMLADSVGGAGTVTTNQWLVYIKGGSDYVESDDADHDGNGGNPGAVLYLDVLGVAAASNVFEGYASSPGDGGIATLDADTNTLANALRITAGGNHLYTIFKNLDGQGASSDGFNGNNTGEKTYVFKNCRAFDNGAAGFQLNDNFTMVSCYSENNTSLGFDGDSSGFYVACVSFNNGGHGMFGANTTEFYLCLSASNTGHQIVTTGIVPKVILCSTDGEGNANYGYKQDSGTGAVNPVVINNIFHDSDHGIFSDFDHGEMVTSRFNLFNDSGTADVNANWLVTSTGDGVGDRADIVDPGPPFTDEVGAGLIDRDYTPLKGLALGLGANFTVSFWNDYNNGAGNNPPAE